VDSLIFKKLFLIFTLLFFVACSQNPVQTAHISQTIPTWYLKPTPNSEIYLYGTGEGKTLQEAKNSALNDMASRLSVTLDSSIQQYKQSVSFNTTQSYQKNITEKINVEVKAINFTNASIEHSEVVANSFFVLAKVNRQELFNSYKNAFDLSESTLNSTLQNSKNKPILERIYTLQTVLPTIEKATSQAIILSAINTQFDSNSYLMKYTAISNDISTLKDQLKIKIATNLSQKLFANEFIDALNQEGYKVSNSQPNVEIQLLSTVNYSIALGWEIAKVSTTISVISEGKIVSNNIISSVGRSSSSSENALLNASKTFKQEVLKKGLNAILFNQ
jgi:hypothetical protein